MLRYKDDRQTIVYMCIATALLVVQWVLPAFNPLLFVWAMFMAITVAIISHNHNHVRTWKSSLPNALMEYWLTLFYGYPTFGWIPTHNMNHHKLNNREGDYTITYRFSEKNNLLTLLTYPSISGYFQQRPIRDYLKLLRGTNRKRFWYCVSQYAVLIVYLLAALWLDWKKALLYIVIPQQFSLFSVLVFNYVQHVHADEMSPINHSRNFVGKLMNRLLLNNGFHTVHHDQPGLHWSKLPLAHAEVAQKIDPRLIEESFWWFMVRSYILGMFFPRFRTQSLRRERMKRSSEFPQHQGVGAPAV